METKTPPPKPLNARQEIFAQAVARGATPLDACVEAGYRRRRQTSKRLMAYDAVTDRVKEIQDHLTWGGSGDLAPVIDELAALAKMAWTLKSGSALAAARGLLAEAARLKQLLPRPRTADEIDDDLPHDQWLKKYGAKS